MNSTFDPPQTQRHGLAIWPTKPLFAAILVSLACGTPAFAESTAPHVPAVAASELADPLKGLVLLGELNCTACHAAGAQSEKITPKSAPRLSAVGERINPHYLADFLAAPHEVKPGTTMPDALSPLTGDEKNQVAKTLAHFLLSTSNAKRFSLEAIDTVAAEEGEVLFHSVGCIACHSPMKADGSSVLPETSVPLVDLETKYSLKSLADFLRSPHRVRPSGRMPDMKLNDQEARRLANYLLRETRVPGHLQYTLLRGRVWEGLDVNVTKESAGHVDNFDLANLKQISGNSAVIYEGYLDVKTAGEYKFFLDFNGGELWLNDKKVVELQASNRRGVKSAEGSAELQAGWNKIKLVYIHAGKEPRLKFEMSGPDLPKQAIPAERLSISNTPIETLPKFVVDEDLAAKGKTNFMTYGCANCHDDLKLEAKMFKPLAEVAAGKGCLSGETGKWPNYDLSASQTQLLTTAIKDVGKIELAPADIVSKTLVTFNCIGCHDRAGLGGVSPERNQYFTGTKKELGNEGRIPPPLTYVGAKLQPHWIKEVLINGREQREYLDARMPKFGEGNVGHLVELFGQVDSVEEVEFDEIADMDAYKAAGHELVGTTGFSCIACHDFNGQKAGGPGAMDIVAATERLNKDWFYLYLLKPSRFHPGTIMPASWPGGHAFKKDILNGDTKKQIESIWVYLEDGTRAKNPIGLSRKSPELRVTDETLICRGRGNAGYRSIGVGYPERVSLALDSEEMNLRLLWKGEFATAQEGSFSARGGDRIEFPKGIPFHKLKSLDDNWPYKRETDYLFPQDHGYRFRGYYLGEKKRPTFMYEYGDVSIEEYFEDKVDDEKNAYFRRTFTFDAPKAQEKFYFRAASGKGIRQVGESKTFAVERLNVTIVSDNEGVVRDGDPNELLIPLELPAGKSTLVLEYKW